VTVGRRFVARFHEFNCHEGGRRGEGDASVFLTGGQPQCQAIWVLPVRMPERDAVLSRLDPFAARQFENSALLSEAGR